MADPVEAITTGIANVTVDTTDAPSPAAATAAAASLSDGRRLYIGNLAYETNEEELKGLFQPYKLESVSIPTNPRTNRHVGYAFVELETAAEAERAISELNGQELTKRKISVQLARKPEHPEGEERRASRTRGSRRGARNGRGPRQGKEDEAAGQTAEAAANAPANGSDNADAPAASSEGRPRRAPRKRGPPEDGVPSKVKVMVANLPFDLREEKLLEIFKEYQPVAAKIALRPIPPFIIKKLKARGEVRRGRGFGFVTLASEEMQKKACEEMNDKEIDGRQIAVKVAIDKEEAPKNDTADATESAESPAKEPVEAAEPAAAATEAAA